MKIYKSFGSYVKNSVDYSQLWLWFLTGCRTQGIQPHKVRTPSDLWPILEGLPHRLLHQVSAEFHSAAWKWQLHLDSSFDPTTDF